MLDILYLGDYLAAETKPHGVLVHRTGLDAGGTRFALQMLRNQLGRKVWPAHRLDKGTSGVLLFASDLKAPTYKEPQLPIGLGLHEAVLSVTQRIRVCLVFHKMPSSTATATAMAMATAIAR